MVHLNLSEIYHHEVCAINVLFDFARKAGPYIEHGTLIAGDDWGQCGSKPSKVEKVESGSNLHPVMRLSRSLF